MKYILKYWFSILSFLVLFIAFTLGFQSFQENTDAKQKESLEQALKRGIIQTYALEGRYPASLDELISDYQITYDHDQFDVKYEIVASNMMPDITIIEKE